ncbi:DUF3231 family protein [Litchfieldia alkalitelluris]|uniref:DUF3231 family protein n=1 Tax=Litchfieldia alkalitelluris TaxID=304268 RepID=UPI000995FAAF|nr:DUF3231 family protein [Litchfieldia alkalitelluris]
MINILESLLNTLKLEVDNEPKSPLHVGEVTSCWMYVALMDEASIFMQAGLNMTNDDVLRKVLIESLKQCDKQSQKLRNFMKNEGVHLPSVSEPRPDSDPNDVPLGAKLTDNEIANGVSIKTATAIIHCATSASQSIRNDVGTMWIEFMSDKLVFGVSLKTLMRERGWIKVPPYYYPPGMPTNG